MTQGLVAASNLVASCPPTNMHFVAGPRPRFHREKDAERWNQTWRSGFREQAAF